jgi:hypothetical protein
MTCSPSRSSPSRSASGAQASEGWWTRSQSIRTAWYLPLEAALLETAPPPVYQQIAARAKQLIRLGLSNVQIARALGVTDKTVAKAAKWELGAN